ncbi:MAG: hypothetical protein IJ747_03940 [Lachnospiraceae bacterium]|nr:hypothetical protein [Eubacterium sp.]MBR1771161.1 hypothetical protein [Lachnospiraceae bacterium]
METLLHFSPNLYLGDGIQAKKLDKIKEKLINKPLLANVYILALAHNPEDQLEFFDARQMLQHYYRQYPLEVVGIAKDYDDALHLVERITRNCLQERGDCRLKEYLVC